MAFLTFHILGIVSPTDELIFFRGLGQPPTSIYLFIYWRPPSANPSWTLLHIYCHIIFWCSVWKRNRHVSRFWALSCFGGRNSGAFEIEYESLFSRVPWKQVQIAPEDHLAGAMFMFGELCFLLRAICNILQQFWRRLVWSLKFSKGEVSTSSPWYARWFSPAPRFYPLFSIIQSCGWYSWWLTSLLICVTFITGVFIQIRQATRSYQTG